MPRAGTAGERVGLESDAPRSAALGREGREAARTAASTDCGLALAPGGLQARRLILAALLICALFVALAARLFKIQALGYAASRERVARMLTGVDSRLAVRGSIRDRNGTNLAVDVPRCVLGIDPSRLTEAEERRVIDFLAAGLGRSESERRTLHARLAKGREIEAAGGGPQRYLAIARGIELRQAKEALARLAEAMEAELAEGGLSGRALQEALRRFRAGPRGGLCLELAHHRDYPRGAFLAHVVGAVSPGERASDLRGLSGIELTLNPYLEGWDGHREVICDGKRLDARLYSPENIDVPPVDGYDAYLTIDARVQGIVEEELERGVRRREAEGGAAIVLDCRSGDLLAMASFPDFDPGLFHGYSTLERNARQRNRAVESQYEPGSTIKPLVAAMALEKQLFRPDQQVWGGGRLGTVLGKRVEDVHDHGPISFAEALVHSSNIGMAQVGTRLGADGLNEMLDRFRLAAPTGLPLPGEARGFRCPRAQWSERNHSVYVSFGYTVSVTPIQMAAAYAALVNGGRYFRPRLVERLERGGEVHRFAPEMLGAAATPQVSAQMRDLLHLVVKDWTGKEHATPGLLYGGKTGTAKLARGRRGYSADGKVEYLSSFVGFAPYEPGKEPELVVLVMVERPNARLGYYGKVVAAPVAAAILRRIYRLPEEPPPVAVRDALPPPGARAIAGGG